MKIKYKYLLVLGIFMTLSMVGCSELTAANAAMAKIAAYATDSSKPKPTVADYAVAGIKGVDVANLNAVNAGVVAADVATVAKIQKIATNVAMAKIAAYATDSSKPKPTIADYIAAGIKGVDAANLNVVNAGVVAANSTGVDTVAKIQKIVTKAKADFAMAKITAHATTNAFKLAPTVDDYKAVGVDVAGVDIVAKIQKIVIKTQKIVIKAKADAAADAAMAKIAAYVDDSENKTAPTIADYETAGVAGVTAAKLNVVNYGLLGDGEDVKTVVGIQKIVNEVLILPSAITINASAEGVVLSVSNTSPTIDAQGVVSAKNTDNAVNVSMQYTVTGSDAIILPPYSKKITIVDADIEDDASGMVATFSWEQKNLKVGSGTFNATITTDREFNAKKLDIENDVKGKVVATFRYPRGNSSSLGTATLRVMLGIPDRMFGLADNYGNTDTHKFLYLPVINPITGRTWLNNNLGAEYADTTNPNGNFNPAQQATASNDYKAYGSLFQWGRKADGHELINWTNGATGNIKFGTKDTKFKAHKTNAHDDSKDTKDTKFKVHKKNAHDDSKDTKFKEYKTRDDNLWENESSANNICPVGYRLPTAGDDGTNMEWEVEVDSWNEDNALAGTLKLPMSGVSNYSYRDDVTFEGVIGVYWSASYGRNLYFELNTVDPSAPNKRNLAFAVRCIKD
jgi:hypothetical protein